MKILHPENIACILGKSVRWVYTYASELGATRIGGSWIFTEEGLQNALQGQQTMAWRGKTGWNQSRSKKVPNKKTGNRMGKRKAKGTGSDREEAARRHGLDDLLN